MNPNEIDPSTIFISDIKSKNPLLISLCVDHFETLSALVGPEKTKKLFTEINEMIDSVNITHFKFDSGNYESQKIIISIQRLAKTIDRSFINFVGGYQNLNCIFNLLEKMLRFPDFEVRKNATKSIKTFLVATEEKLCNKEIIVQEILKLLKSLSLDSPTTPSKLAALKIVKPFSKFLFGIYKNPQNIEMGCDNKVNCHTVNSLLFQSINDQSFLVRNEAVEVLIKVAFCVNENVLKKHIKNILIRVFGDFRSEIKLKIVKLCVVCLENFENSDDQRNAAISCLFKSFKHCFWELRKECAENFVSIFKTMKKDKKGKLTECFLKLLEDEEEQVSISAIKQIVDLFSITGDDFFEFKENIYNRLKLAAENQQFSVMNNVISEQLGDLVKVETKFSQEILDLIKIYLNSDQEILVVNILSKSNLLLNKMGYQNFVAHFNEPLLKISDSSNWRFRLSALKTISLLSEKLTETEFEQFIKTLEKLLEDETQKIREESCLMSWKLLKKFGFEWSSKNVLPFIRDLSDVQRYLHRMTPLFFLFQIEEKVDDRMNDFVIKIFKKLLNDRISNVKDFALRVVDKISPFLNTEIAALVFEESKSARQ